MCVSVSVCASLRLCPRLRVCVCAAPDEAKVVSAVHVSAVDQHAVLELGRRRGRLTYGGGSRGVSRRPCPPYTPLGRSGHKTPAWYSPDLSTGHLVGHLVARSSAPHYVSTGHGVALA
eukprot:3940979-Rhodomonas_salina.1